MRKTLITFTVAAMIVVPGLTARLQAGVGNDALREEQRGNVETDVKAPGGSKESARDEKMDEGATKTAEVQKAEEAKKDEDERKDAEEAKKIIVARVNGTEINMFMLVRAMNSVAPKYVKKGEAVTPETSKKIKREALDRLIFEELAVEEAIEKGINPTPEAIEKVVRQVKENLGSEQDYREYLEKSNLTEDALKKLIERSQRYEMITAREIYGKVKVDEKLVRDEYEKEKGNYILAENFVVEDVFFPNGNDDEITRKKADEILKTIEKNNNDVWKLVLDGTFIVREINVKKERYPKIHRTMTDMKVGDLSGVIKDKDGFHIIKVKKKEPSRQLTFEEAKDTIKLKFLVPAQDQRKQEWEKELREKAKIAVMLDEVEKKLKENTEKQTK